MTSSTLERASHARGWARELAIAALALAAGFGILPGLIFFAGSSTLGRYEGASLGGVYDGVYRGLEGGSVASWVVVLGPYGFYLLFKALRLGWSWGARPD